MFKYCWHSSGVSERVRRDLASAINFSTHTIRMTGHQNSRVAVNAGVSTYTLINLEQKGNMTRPKMEADANKPTTHMLETMLVLEASK